ncbi:MAG: ankyrin repeat domain-containing protein [Bacteroidota bacterium]
MLTEVKEVKHIAKQLLPSVPDDERTYHYTDQPYWNSSGYQGQIPRPSESQIVICILGERAGMPLPASFELPTGFALPNGVLFPCQDPTTLTGNRKPTGDIPLTGTIYEYLDARFSLSSTGEQPSLLVFIRGDESVKRVESSPGSRNWGRGELLDRTYEMKKYGKISHDEWIARNKEYDSQIILLSRFFDRFISKNGANVFSDINDFAERIRNVLRDKFRLDKQWRGNPYKGLKTYGVNDSFIYCGHDDNIRVHATELWNRLETPVRDTDTPKADRPPVLMVYGPSGHGKSSFVQAGLAPALHEGRYNRTVKGQVLPACIFTASSLGVSEDGVAVDPLVSILRHLASDLLPDLQEVADHLEDVLTPGLADPEERICYALDRVADALDARGAAETKASPYLFMSLDQLEEILPMRQGGETRAWDEALAFILRLAEKRRAVVVLTFRADLSEINAWVEQAVPEVGSPNEFVLYWHTTSTWDAIIREPFRRCGLKVAADLFDHLKQQAIEIGSLPLLSTTLRKVYAAYEVKSREVVPETVKNTNATPLVGTTLDLATTTPPVGPTLDLATYEEWANMKESIEELGKSALKVAAEARDADHESPTNPDHEALARILRCLVRIVVDPETGETLNMRKPALMESFPEEVKALVKALLSVGLVIEDKGRVNLAHEAVLGHWSAAKQWREREREHLATQARLSQLARRWYERRGDTDTPLASRKEEELPSLPYIEVDSGESMLTAWRHDPPKYPELIRYVKELMLSQTQQKSYFTEDGIPRLYDAVKLEDIDLVRAILDAGASPNVHAPLRQEREDGRLVKRGEETPLQEAAQLGNEAIVRLLLERGADVNLLNARGHTALDIAAFGGYDGIVRLLHEEHGARVNHEGGEWTALIFAAGGGHERVVRLLLEYGADSERPGIDGFTPLHWAAIYGHSSVIKLLVESGGANIDAMSPQRRTPLAEAALSEKADAVQMLLRLGAQPDTKVSAPINTIGVCTAIHLAAAVGDVACLKSLIEGGGDPSVLTNANDTVLTVAVREEKTEVARWILEHAPSVDVHAHGAAGRTALFHALRLQDPDLITALVDAGAQPPFWLGPDPVNPLRGIELRQCLLAGWHRNDLPSPTSLSPPPVLQGEWTVLDREEALDTLTAALEVVPDGLGCGLVGIDEVRMLLPSFYPTAQLYEIHVRYLDGEFGLVSFIASNGKYWWLDGDNTPIFELNESSPINLRSPEAPSEYLRFFFASVSGRHGTFDIVESPEWLNVEDAVNSNEIEIMESLLRPVEVVGCTSGGVGKFGVVWSNSVIKFKNSLFESDYHIDSEGNIALKNEKLLVENVSMHQVRICDGVRIYDIDKINGGFKSHLCKPYVCLGGHSSCPDVPLSGWPLPPIVQGQSWDWVENGVSSLPEVFRSDLELSMGDVPEAMSMTWGIKWLGNIELIEAAVDLDGSKLLTLLRFPHGVVHRLDGSASPLESLQQHVYLTSPRSVEDYLRLYLRAYLRGSFTSLVVDSPYSIPWSGAPSDDELNQVYSAIHPMVIDSVASPGEGQPPVWSVKTVVLNGSELQELRCTVTAKGGVTFDEVIPRISQLTVISESYEDRVRQYLLPRASDRSAS